MHFVIGLRGQWCQMPKWGNIFAEEIDKTEIGNNSILVACLKT